MIVACDRDGYLYFSWLYDYGTGGLGLVASVWSAASETPHARGSRDGGEWSGSVVALLLRD